MRFLRRLKRCFWVLVIAAIGMAHYALLRMRGRLSRPERARWLQKTTRRVLPYLGVHWQVAGEAPRTGLIVSNHISYVDILVFSAAIGCSFVSKAEVKDWPLFGPFAKLSGTVFVWRHSAADSVRAYSELRECLKEGHPVVLFPEGTTNDGEKVLPFRSTMFQAAIDVGAPVIPALISYSIDDGTVREDIAFWGDMEALPHAMNLFTKRHMECRIHFGDPLAASDDRKQMARTAYEWVTERAPAVREESFEKLETRN